MTRALQVIALCFVAYQANCSILEPDVLGPCGSAVQKVGRQLLAWLGRDVIQPRSIQDPLSFRCVAQVLGAFEEPLAWLERVVARQLNEGLDNPLVLLSLEELVSNGNFDTTELAVASDAVRSLIHRALVMSERRIGKLLDERFSGLTTGLSIRAGDSGFDILHHTALGLAGDSTRHVHPTLSQMGAAAQGVEDYGAMATTGAFSLWDLVEQWQTVMSIEAVVATRAISQRRCLIPTSLAPVYEELRSVLDRDSTPGDQVQSALHYLFGSVRMHARAML